MDEGGQGHIHLQSRAAAFCRQFLQSPLHGHEEFNWRTAECTILNSTERLNLSKSLFLMDPCNVDTITLSAFYRNLFKVSNLFNRDQVYPLLASRVTSNPWGLIGLNIH
ncbi:uncharacterized protein LOC122995885 [Tachysurus ichikawai]